MEEALPHEIMLEILSRLSMTSLVQTKLVCRAWHNFAQHPLIFPPHNTYITRRNPSLILYSDTPVQTQIYYVDHSDDAKIVKKLNLFTLPDFNLVGSCNGLLCLCNSSQGETTLFICNPFTRDFIQFSESKCLVWYVYEKPLFGFGFDSSKKDYKVIKISNCGTRNKGRHQNGLTLEAKVEIFTISSQTWRDLGSIPYRFVGSHSQAFVNGKLHWVAWQNRNGVAARKFVSFDLATEQFQEIALPGCGRLDNWNPDLVILKGFLCAIYQSGNKIDVWVMRDYNVKDAWIKEYSIENYRGFEVTDDLPYRNSSFWENRAGVKVLCFMETGEVLLEYKCRALLSYDPKSKEFKAVSYQGMPNWFKAIVHIGSLSRIHNLFVCDRVPAMTGNTSGLAMETLPHEVVQDVLSRLPISCMIQAQLVCRSWRDMVRVPLVVHMHFSSSKENSNSSLMLYSDYPVKNQIFTLQLSNFNESIGKLKKIDLPSMPELGVVGYCKSLLCICDSRNKNSIFIYNPSNKDYKLLPEPIQYRNQDVVHGFGFGLKSHEYKVIRATSHAFGGLFSRRRFSRQTSEVQVLTVDNTASWRSLGPLENRIVPCSFQVSLKGRLHWVTYPFRVNIGHRITSFDIDDEKFRDVVIPACGRLDRCGFHLLVLGSCLSASVWVETEELEIWVMREYGVKESWIKDFKIGGYVPRGLERDVDIHFILSTSYLNSSLVKVLCLLSNGEILLEYKCRALVSYDPMSGTFKDFNHQGLPHWFLAAYVGSDLDRVHMQWKVYRARLDNCQSELNIVVILMHFSSLKTSTRLISNPLQ